MAETAYLRVLPGSARQNGYLYRLLPGTTDTYFAVTTTPLTGDVALASEPGIFVRVSPDRFPPTAFAPPADIAVVITPSPSTPGGTLDFSDPANSGHIPGI